MPSTEVAACTLKGLGLMFATYADRNGGSIYPSVGTLAWYLGVDRRTVQRGIRDLCAIGILVELEPGGGRGHTGKFRFSKETLMALACDPPRHQNRDSAATLSSDANGGAATAKGRHASQETASALTGKGDSSVTRSVRDLAVDLSGEITGADAPRPHLPPERQLAYRAFGEAETLDDVPGLYCRLCGEAGLSPDREAFETVARTMRITRGANEAYRLAKRKSR